MSMIASILSSAEVLSAIHNLASEETTDLAKQAMGSGVQCLLRRLHPTDRQKAARQALRLFAEAWSNELESRSSFTEALPGYKDQLQKLIATAAAEIAEWMDPETRTVDLRRIETTWAELGLDALPEDFDWKLVAQSYAQAIRTYIKKDAALRAAYDTALRERTVKAVEHLRGPAPGFDLEAYRKFLIENRCNGLQLAVMHASAYDDERKLTLWSVFVEPSARESAPILDLPPEFLRHHRKNGYAAESDKVAALGVWQRHYLSSPVRPIFQILDRERLVAVTGDPGSGKSSLLKYRTLMWAVKNKGPVPLFIDLKDYARDRKGLLEYCQFGCETYRLDATELEQLLKTGQAAFYLDGLDEIFDGPVRNAVMEEIGILSARYRSARFVVTSRKLGYNPTHLTNAHFLHATLEDFDQQQMFEFLRKWNFQAEKNKAERQQLDERLTRAIDESPAIRELSGNPLLLTMMAILNRHQELPRDRVELYFEASKVLLYEWDAHHALPEDTFAWQEKGALLRKLAGDMQQARGGLAGNLIHRDRLLALIRTFLDQLGIGDSFEKAKLLVQQLTERNFILAYAGANQFCFVHRTFLEYFCAEWFVDRLGHEKESDLYLSFEQLRDEVFGGHWKDERWHEVLRLIAGMVHATKAEKLIQFLMEQDGAQDKLANLMLAAGCLYEVRNRNTILATDQVLWQRFVCEALRYEVPGNPEDISRIMEVQWMRATTVKWIAVTWRGQNAHEWLKSAALRDRDIFIRQPALRELASGWSNSPETLPFLIDRTHSEHHESVRRVAVESLASTWPKRPETLQCLMQRALNDTAAEVREKAIHLLEEGWPKNSETLSILREAAQNDADGGIRAESIEALARIVPGDPEVLGLLEKLARQEDDPAVRSALVNAVAHGWPDNPGTLAILKDRARNDKNDSVKHDAVMAIVRGWLNDPDALRLLLIRAELDVLDWEKREAKAKLLECWPNDPKVIALLNKPAK